MTEKKPAKKKPAFTFKELLFAYLAISKLMYWMNNINEIQQDGLWEIGRMVVNRLLAQDIVTIWILIAMFLLEHYISTHPSIKTGRIKIILLYSIGYVIYVSSIVVYLVILNIFMDVQIYSWVDLIFGFSLFYVAACVVLYVKDRAKKKEAEMYIPDENAKMSVLDTIKSRTSYRGTFENIDIPRHDLEKIMEAGLSAPSGCNKQTTSLIAVDDKELLTKLREVIQPQAAETATAMICVLTQKIIAYRDKCFNIQDYSAAIQNMLLAAVELGYQSCWYEGHITDTDNIGMKMSDILGVPNDYALVCFIPIGKASQPLKTVEKKPFSERAWFNGFRRGSH